MDNSQHTRSTLRTWDGERRCDECCNGDRCDDPTHHARKHCPHCKGTGWALWTEAGQQDYAQYLQSRGLSAHAARAAIAAATGSTHE